MAGTESFESGRSGSLMQQTCQLSREGGERSNFSASWRPQQAWKSVHPCAAQRSPNPGPVTEL